MSMLMSHAYSKHGWQYRAGIVGEFRRAKQPPINSGGGGGVGYAAE